MKFNATFSKDEDLFYFSQNQIIAGITTINFSDWKSGDEYSLPEEKLMQHLQASSLAVLRSRHNSRIAVLNGNTERRYFSDDALVYVGAERSPDLLLVAMVSDEPAVLLFNASAGLCAIIEGSWENIVVDSVRTVVSLIQTRFKLAPAEISAFIWPGICRDCFKPERDLFNYLKAENRKIDLRANLHRQLLDAKVKDERIQSASLCPAHSRQGADFFFNSEVRSGSADVSNLVFIKFKD